MSDIMSSFGNGFIALIVLGVALTLGGIILNLVFMLIIAVIAGIIAYKKFTYPIFAAGLAFWISGTAIATLVIGVLSFILLEQRDKSKKLKEIQ